MPDRSDLEHLREGQRLDGVDLTRAEASALNVTRLVIATPDQQGWRVVAEHRVGVVRCGELVVRVRPKVGALHVLALLARAHRLDVLRLDDGEVDLADDADLTAALAVFFAAEADRAMAAGPLRGYRTEDQALPVLRGRLRLREQYLRHYGVPLPLEVMVDEWTVDIAENRRLRAATQRLLALPGITGALRTRLLRLDRRLCGAHAPRRGEAIEPWTPTRLNARLHRLLALADLVVEHTGLHQGAGPVVASGFVLNMATLFENLVARLVGEHHPGATTQDTMRLDVLGTMTIRPDLVLREDDHVVAVADTKYKLLGDSGRVPNADVYQLVTYCARLGLRVGHLVYASGQAPPEPVQVIGSDVTVAVHAVDITRPIPVVEEQVRHLVDALLSSSSADELDECTTALAG